MVIGAGAQKIGVAGSALRRALLEIFDDLRLRHGAGDLQVAVQAVFGGDVGEKLVNRADADLAQHLLAVGGGFRKVSHDCRLSRHLICRLLYLAIGDFGNFQCSFSSATNFS